MSFGDPVVGRSSSLLTGLLRSSGITSGRLSWARIGQEFRHKCYSLCTHGDPTATSLPRDLDGEPCCPRRGRQPSVVRDKSGELRNKRNGSSQVDRIEGAKLEGTELRSSRHDSLL